MQPPGPAVSICLRRQKAYASIEPVQEWASSKGRKEGNLVKLRAKHKAGEHRIHVPLPFAAIRPFFPPVLCLERNKALPQRLFLFLNTKQKSCNIISTVK